MGTSMVKNLIFGHYMDFIRNHLMYTKPQRGVTMVASRFNGWYIAARK